jgi:hypothetical protein
MIFYFIKRYIFRIALMGCNKMDAHISTGNQKKHFFVFQGVLILCFCSIFLISIYGISSVVSAESTSFCPAPPVGPAFGFVNIVYEYHIMTLNYNSSWQFDWGDGTTTDWLQLATGQSTISQTHQWTTVGTYSVRVQFKSEQITHGVMSDPLTVTITSYTAIDYPHTPLVNSGAIQGYVGYRYYYLISATDPNEGQVCFRFDWGDGVTSQWTSFVASGSLSVQFHTWETPGNYSVKIQARNQYNLESAWCDPVVVMIQNTTEDQEDFVNLVVLNGIEHHIFFTSNHNGTFYNSTTGASSPLLWTGGGEYLVDSDNDGLWEYLYGPAIGEIQQIPEQVITQKDFFSEFGWVLLLITGIIIGIISVILVLIKTGYIYLYEDIVVEK